jgi:glutamyl-tRNA reductase
VHLVVVSLNHRTAPVELRERFAVSEDRLPAALRELKHSRGILEGVMLSTCNRTEVYAVVGRPDLCGAYVREFMENFYGIPAARFARHLQVEEDEAAVRHLFRVACGLDSMVIGETQILGQVKNAYFAAQRERTTGTLLNRLFHQAITVAKRAHAETKINDHAVSVAHAACLLAERHAGSLENRKAMLIGAGQTAALALKHLQARGIGRVTVANRTPERAEALAGQLPGGSACSLAELPERIVEEQPDVVISTTASPEYVLTADQLSGLAGRREKPIVMIDIAVPRDLDPAIARLEHVHLYDIDELQAVVADHMENRLKQADKIEAMIEAELVSYQEWYRLLGVAPVIRALQERAQDVHRSTMDSLLRKLPDLTEREIKVIRKLTKSIANRMMTDPINRIKEMAAGRDGREAVEMFVRIFALEDELAADEPADGRASWQEEAAPREERVALGGGSTRC